MILPFWLLLLWKNSVVIVVVASSSFFFYVPSFLERSNGGRKFVIHLHMPTRYASLVFGNGLS